MKNRLTIGIRFAKWFVSLLNTQIIQKICQPQLQEEHTMTLKKLTLNRNQKGFTLIELMIVIAIIGILAAIAIPNFIAYRNKSFCSAAESDANAVAAEIADYFAIPTHTDIATADITFAPAANTFTIVGPAAVNTAITITVTDASARCPAEYKTANPINAQGDGWVGAASNIYQKVLAQ